MAVTFMPPMRKFLLLIVLFVVLAMVPEPALAQGCAMCKAVVESEQGNGRIFGGEQAVGRGLNTGILYLMAVPYLLLFMLFRKRIVAFFREFGSAQG